MRLASGSFVEQTGLEAGSACPGERAKCDRRDAPNTNNLPGGTSSAGGACTLVGGVGLPGVVLVPFLATGCRLGTALERPIRQPMIRLQIGGAL